MKKGFWIVVALLVASVAINVWFWTTEPEPSIVIKRDTVYNDTTIYEPVPAETIDIGKTVYIKVPVPKYLPGDTVHDSIEVPVPIYQKRYDDSLYTAWVSGYRPALDSISLHQPEIVTTITETIVKPSPRWSVGLSVGPGVSIDKDHHMGIYVGFTAQYRLWPK